MEDKANDIIKDEIAKLQEISGLSKEEAKKRIMARVEETMTKEIAAYIKDREAQAKLDIDKKAKETTAILEKIEKLREETIKNIKKTLTNFIKYMAKELENKKLEVTNKNDFNYILYSTRDFINSFEKDVN